MFPAATVARNVVHSWMLAIFSHPLKFCHVYCAFCHGSYCKHGSCFITFHQGASRRVTFTCQGWYGVLHCALWFVTSNMGLWEHITVCQGIHILPVPLWITYKSCYSLLGAVPFYCIHPILLRPTRFINCTMTAVVKFFTVWNSGTVSIAITFAHPFPLCCLMSIPFCTSPTMVSWNAIAVA